MQNMHFMQSMHSMQYMQFMHSMHSMQSMQFIQSHTVHYHDQWPGTSQYFQSSDDRVCRKQLTNILPSLSTVFCRDILPISWTTFCLFSWNSAPIWGADIQKFRNSQSRIMQTFKSRFKTYKFVWGLHCNNHKQAGVKLLWVAILFFCFFLLFTFLLKRARNLHWQSTSGDRKEMTTFLKSLQTFWHFRYADIKATFDHIETHITLYTPTTFQNWHPSHFCL